MSRLFHLPASSWITRLAILYAVGGWALGIWLVTRPEILSNVAGVLLITHTLVTSAYLLHDCASRRLCNDPRQ